MEEVVRMFLVLAHLGAMMAAAVAVAFGDYALLGRRRIDGMLLGKASHAVAWALAGLWLSGLAIVGVDTGFEWAVILAKPKLMAKLTVVVLLTANGFYLHRVVLPSLLNPGGAARPLAHVAARAARAGAFSAAGWSVAVFLGVARPLAPLLGYAGFIGLFGLAVAAALVLAWRLVHPPLYQRLKTEHAAPDDLLPPGAALGPIARGLPHTSAAA